ncbi:hypothetical protein KC318_g14960 [Hortaea werneckii]|nr:hypothetical protein KC334_g2116 [Hortaea werneckii]KAI7203935.1 hypothetical protein KC324_g1008 [Hortaea werneckii]KAI7593956.1 hypothetical protein KC316_g1432 [Hortaea werneckii]KAI7652452.1 hypothetical protein KC318_g14960 [Hortaea werneckii]
MAPDIRSSLAKWEIRDSQLEHNNWKFPGHLKTRPLRDLEDDDFLVHHKAIRFKLLVANAVNANLENTGKLPLKPDVHEIVKQQRWISDEYEHLWRRDGAFMLQTPRDGKSFCSLSLVNRERTHCGGLFVADDRYGYDLNTLLASQPYQNRHPKVPRDLAILPFSILVHHVEETLEHAQKLSREVTSTEKRITDGDIKLEDNGDYKLLNRLNLEHIRLQKRSDFELELAENLTKYIDEYHRIWAALWEGGTSYIEDMKERIEQQMRYSRQVQRDLLILPRRIKNQSKAISNYIIQRDNKLNIQLAESNKKIAEESRRDNLLNAAMKTIAIVTLTFLPGTAVASFFSMTMFQWPFENENSIASPYTWVYFVVTVPLTLMVYAAWHFWLRYSQTRYKKTHEEGLNKFEQELKTRVRSATGTW